MSLDIQAGAEPTPTPASTGTARPPKADLPVARPAKPKAKIRIKPTDEPQADLVEDLLSPPSVRSFAFSVAGHALVLLVLAFWYFAPPLTPARVFDTTLAGSEFGDPSSDQLKGGLGMDTPLAMPESSLGPVLTQAEPTFTAIPVEEIAPPPTAARRIVAGAANGGGLNVANPGQAGDGDGFGIAKFGHGGENINGVDVKVGDPQFTLIWDTRTDIDLHVVEPGGYEIYWENRGRLSPQGGDIDVDDVDGFGPENINYEEGRGPRGVYRWFVHYYGPAPGTGGANLPTRWKVRVKHGGKIDLYQGRFSRVDQKSQTFELRLADDASAARPPADPRETARGGLVEPPAPIAPATANAAPVPPPAAGPRVFAPPGGGFSARFPGEPTAGRKDWETPLGPIVAQVYSRDGSEGGLSVATLDFPASALAKADPGGLLDDLASRFLADAKAIPGHRAKVALDGSPGREAEFSVPDSVVAGGGLGKVRVYLAGSRAVVASAVGSKSYLASPEVEEFFKALKLPPAK